MVVMSARFGIKSWLFLTTYMTLTKSLISLWLRFLILGIIKVPLLMKQLRRLKLLYANCLGKCLAHNTQSISIITIQIIQQIL